MPTNNTPTAGQQQDINHSNDANFNRGYYRPYNYYTNIYPYYPIQNAQVVVPLDYQIPSSCQAQIDLYNQKIRQYNALYNNAIINNNLTLANQYQAVVTQTKIDLRNYASANNCSYLLNNIVSYFHYIVNPYQYNTNAVQTLQARNNFNYNNGFISNQGTLQF